MSNLTTRVAARADLQVTHMAAAKRTAVGRLSRGNRTTKVTPRRMGGHPGQELQGTRLNSCDGCSKRTGWSFALTDGNGDLSETTAREPGE